MERQALETGGENTAATYDAKRVCAWTGLCLTGLLLFGSGLQWLWAAGIGALLPEPLNNMWVQTFVPLQMIAMPVTIVLLSRTKGSAPEKRTMPFGWLARGFVIAYAVMVIGNLIGTVLMMMFTGGKAQNPLIAYSLDPGSEALKVLFIVLLGPFLEEILFRKLLIDRTRLFGEKNAILFSALLFGLFHVNLFQFFYAFGIGLIFGYIYVRTGKVLYTWVIHAILNFCYCVIPGWLFRYDEKLMPFYGLILIGIAVSGIILLILNRKKWELAPVAEGISEKALRRDMLLNAGVIGFYVMTTALTVLMIFQTMGGGSTV